MLERVKTADRHKLGASATTDCAVSVCRTLGPESSLPQNELPLFRAKAFSPKPDYFNSRIGAYPYPPTTLTVATGSGYGAG